jgi:DNA repair protein RadC
MAARATEVRIISSEQAAALFVDTFGHHGTEELRAAHLSKDRELIALRLYGGESPSGFELPIRSIVAEALVLSSHGLLIAHNHPSGDPTPSRADIVATRALAEVATSLGIRFYDHLIFAAGGWKSLMALGLL